MTTSRSLGQGLAGYLGYILADQVTPYLVRQSTSRIPKGNASQAHRVLHPSSWFHEGICNTDCLILRLLQHRYQCTECWESVAISRSPSSV